MGSIGRRNSTRDDAHNERIDKRTEEDRTNNSLEDSDSTMDLDLNNSCNMSSPEVQCDSQSPNVDDLLLVISNVIF